MYTDLQKTLEDENSSAGILAFSRERARLVMRAHRIRNGFLTDAELAANGVVQWLPSTEEELNDLP